MLKNNFDRREDIIDFCNSIFRLIRQKDTSDVFTPNDDFLKVSNIKKHAISIELMQFTDEFYTETIKKLIHIRDKYK